MVLRADAGRLPLPDESVDLVVTSPPYFALRSYQDGGEHYDGQIGSEPSPQEFLEALWAVTAECWRVLKPTGSLFLNLGDKWAGTGGGNGHTGVSAKSTLAGNGHKGGGPKLKATPRAADAFTAPRNNTKQSSGFVRNKSLMGLPWRYAIGCTDGKADPTGIGWVLRSEIIWAKTNGLPESARDRVQRKHEQWFHLTKEPTYFADLDLVRTPYADDQDHGAPKPYADGEGPRHGRNNSTLRLAGSHPLGKLPGSVWKVSTVPLVVPDHVDVDHFAAFPPEFPRRCILGWSPPGGVVLDPFGGTGTTAMVARALGRRGVSVDLSADYCRLARWRVFESDGASKVREKTNRASEPSLFGALEAL